MATAGEGTPKSSSSKAKAKPALTIQGFKYILGATRKDGSETWKCAEKDCEGRLHKKTEGQIKTIKDHSIQTASTSGNLYHLYMYCLKDRALKFPNESPADVRKQVTRAVTEIVIATVPSPNAIETAIQEWREISAAAATKKSTRTPKSKDGGGAKLKTPKSRKRLKLATGDEEVEEEEDGEDTPIASKSMRKRSRSRSVDNLSEEEEEEEEQEENSDEE